jgi:arsenite transporter
MSLLTSQRRIRIPVGMCVLVAIPLGLCVGKICGPQDVDALIFIALFLMLYPSMLEVDLAGFKRALLQPGLVAASLFLNFVVSPILVFGLLHLFAGLSEPNVTVGVTLYGTVPGGSMAPAFTGILRGNVNLSVTISAISSFLSPGIVPLWTEWLIGTHLAVPASLIFRHLCFIIAIPLIVAVLTRWVIVAGNGEATFRVLKERIKGLSHFGLFTLLFAMSFMYGDRILNEPLLVVRTAGPVSAFLTILFLLSGLLGKALRSLAGDAVAFTLATTAKNNAVSLALAFSAFGGDAALVNAIAGPLVQLPMLLGYVALKRSSKEYLNRVE